MRVRSWLALAALVLGSAAGSSAQTGTIDVGDARLGYEVSGRGEPVVLIHGWALNMHEWNDQARAFSTHYRVIRYDLRGFGRSTGFPDVTADPADLATVLDSLGISSAYLVGHSRGAAVALAFALAFPGRVRGLVLYGSPPPQGFGLPFDGPDGPGDRRAIARQFGLDSVKAALLRHPITWMPPERVGAFRRRLDTLWAEYSGRDLLEDHPPSNRVARARIDHLREIQVPTLVLTGDHEMPYLQVVSAALAYGITGAKRVVLTGGGHGAHFAQPQGFNAAVLAFLDSASRAEKQASPNR